MTSRPAVLALLVLTTGCMVGPDYHRPDAPTPTAWGELSPPPSPRPDGQPLETSHPLAGGVPKAWWDTFDDGLLTSLVERAVASNFDLVAAEARVRAARSSRAISASALWPAIGSSFNYTRQRTSENSPGIAVGRTFSLFQTGFDANWEVDVFGGNRRAVESADADLEAAIHDRDAVLITIMGEVGLEYVTYRSLQRRIVLAEENLRSQQSTLDLTRRLFAAGLAPELDVQRAVSQVATTAATIPLMEQQRQQAMHALGTLVGEPPMSLRHELAPESPIPQPPPEVAVGLPSDLLRRRPDVARAERIVAAATAEIGVAMRDLYPRFFLLGMAGLQSIAASDLFTWESRAASVGPRIVWPVFQGGRIRATVELRNAEQEAALASYRSTVLQAFEDVEDALAAFAGAQESRAQLGDAVSANEHAVDLARRAYAQGLTDFLTVLVAQQNLFISQDALAQQERDVAIDLVALYKAIGGGWETRTAVAAR